MPAPALFTRHRKYGGLVSPEETKPQLHVKDEDELRAVEGVGTFAFGITGGAGAGELVQYNGITMENTN